MYRLLYYALIEAGVQLQFYRRRLIVGAAFSSFFYRGRKLAQYFRRKHSGFARADRESGQCQYSFSSNSRDTDFRCTSAEAFQASIRSLVI